MEITRLAIAPDGPAAPTGSSALDVEHGADATISYRLTRYATLATGGHAERVLVSEASTLSGRFESLRFDALAADGTLRASVSEVDQGLRIGFDAPRRIVAIRLAASRAATGSQLELYRLDGTTRAPEPAVVLLGSSELLNSAAGRRPAEERVDGPRPIPLAPPIERLVRRPTATRFPVDLVSTAVDLVLRGTSLQGVDLLGIDIQSPPAAPRIVLRLETGEAEEARVWQVGGEVVDGDPAGQVEAGRETAATLQRSLDRVATGPGSMLPRNLAMAITFESDAPCRFASHDLRVEYRLIRSSLPSGRDKETRILAAGERQEFPIEVPGDALIHALRLDASISAGAERPVGEPLGAPRIREGLELDSSRGAAQAVEVPHAMRLAAVALHLRPLDDAIRVAVAWTGDDQGRPLRGGDRELGEIELDGARNRDQWAMFTPPAPLRLAAGRYWLLVRVRRGRVLWATDEIAAAGHSAPLRIVTDADRDPAADGAAVPERTARTRLLAAGGNQGPALRATIAAVEVPATPGPTSGSLVFDATAAATAWLASNRGSGLRDLPVVLHADVALRLTLYPPYLEYDLTP